MIMRSFFGNIAMKRIEIEVVYKDSKVLFRGKVPEELRHLDAVVSLSRIPGKCIFPISELHKHDDHASNFSTKEQQDAYRDRVIQEIIEAVTKQS